MIVYILLGIILVLGTALGYFIGNRRGYEQGTTDVIFYYQEETYTETMNEANALLEDAKTKQIETEILLQQLKNIGGFDFELSKKETNH